MKYLLDVNALVALGFIRHEFHDRVAAWLVLQKSSAMATCSITELGLVRVLSQAPFYGFTVAQARTLLLRLKRTNIVSFAFLSDDQDITSLPAWVKSPRQTADGHLAELANRHGAIFATLDAKIPGAYLIPSERS